MRHLYSLYGDREAVQRVGMVFFAGRWPLVRYSPWNQARARGQVTRVRLGPMKHMGRDGYLSTTALLPDGRSYLVPEDIRALAVPVLAHRLILTLEAEVRGVTAEQVVDWILAETPVPRTAGA